VIEGNEEQLLFHTEEIFPLANQGYGDRLAAIDVPVLFVNGARDKYTTLEDAQRL
jgi:rhamnosyltransferase subunit A